MLIGPINGSILVEEIPFAARNVTHSIGFNTEPRPSGSRHEKAVRKDPGGSSCVVNSLECVEYQLTLVMIRIYATRNFFRWVQLVQLGMFFQKPLERIVEWWLKAPTLVFWLTCPRFPLLLLSIFIPVSHKREFH